MKQIEQRIKEFVQSPDVTREALALMLIGRNKGHSPHTIMQTVLASALLRFHGIPLKTGDS